MASTYPTSLDNFTNPTVSDYLTLKQAVLSAEHQLSVSHLIINQ